MYVGEIGVDATLGIALCTLMSMITITTYLVPLLVTGSLGVVNTFYMIASFQFCTIAILYTFMKESKGLSL